MECSWNGQYTYPLDKKKSHGICTFALVEGRWWQKVNPSGWLGSDGDELVLKIIFSFSWWYYKVKSLFLKVSAPARGHCSGSVVYESEDIQGKHTNSEGGAWPKAMTNTIRKTRPYQIIIKKRCPSLLIQSTPILKRGDGLCQIRLISRKNSITSTYHLKQAEGLDAPSLSLPQQWTWMGNWWNLYGVSPNWWIPHTGCESWWSKHPHYCQYLEACTCGGCREAICFAAYMTISKVLSLLWVESLTDRFYFPLGAGLATVIQPCLEEVHWWDPLQSVL